MQLIERLSRWARVVLLPVGFGVVVLCLGASRVGDTAYWMDEAATRRFVDRSLYGLLRLMWAQEGSMGPYFSALWAWVKVFPGESGARMLSVIGGALAAGAVVAVARRWFDTTVAVLAGVFLITNPFFLRYLTELRAYSWLMAVSVAFGWTVVEFVERPTMRWAVLAGCAAGLGTALHYPFALWAVGALLTLVAARLVGRQHFGQVAVAALVATVLVLPFAHVVYVRPGQIDWISRPTVRDILIVGRTFVGGALVGLVLLVGLGAAIYALTSIRRPLGTNAAAPIVSLAMAIVGPVTLAVISFAKPMLIARYLAPAAPFVAISAAWGFVAVSRRLGSERIRRGLIAGAGLVVVLGFVVSGPFSDESRDSDPRATVEFVVDQLEPGDLVVIDRPTEAILHYLGERPDIDPGWAGPQGKSPYFPRRPVAEIAEELQSADRLFVFLFADPTPSDDVGEILGGRDIEVHRFGRSIVLIAD